MDFLQIFRICPPRGSRVDYNLGGIRQQLLQWEHFRFSGIKVCGCSTAKTHARIYAKFLGHVYPEDYPNFSQITRSPTFGRAFTW